MNRRSFIKSAMRSIAVVAVGMKLPYSELSIADASVEQCRCGNPSMHTGQTVHDLRAAAREAQKEWWARVFDESVLEQVEAA